MADAEMEFDHVGVPTTERQPDEDWVEQTRVWVTNPRQHPYRIEYLRFEPDSPCTWEIQNRPHVAYRVQSIDPYLTQGEIVLGPFQVADMARVVFVKQHGLITEYMQYLDGRWFGQDES